MVRIKDDKVVKIAVSLDKDCLEKIDNNIRKGIFISRSQGIRACINYYFSFKEKGEK